MPFRAPTSEPEQAQHDRADRRADDERHDARVRAAAELVRDPRVQEVGSVRAEQDRDGRPGEEREDDRARHAAGVERRQDAAGAQQHEQLRPEQDAPAHGAEQPLPEEQDGADRQQEGDEDECGERDAGGTGNDLDLVADLGGLGLGQVDVGPHEAEDRVLRRPACCLRLAGGGLPPPRDAPA